MVQQRVEPTEHDNEYKIRQFCLEAVQDIERMNAQIRRLQSTLDSITQKRDTLQRQVSAYRRSIAPPIPVEILQHIFRSCVELFPVISSSGCVEAPVLLTHVCSQWCSIALDTPDLWSAMHIVVPNHNVFRFASKRRRILETMGAFIKRSRDLPLHISVYSGLFYKHIFETELIHEDREDIDAIVEVLETLVIYSRRWKYLKLLIPFHCYNRATSRLKSEHVPQLETAMVAGRGVDFLLNAPRLRQLALQYPTHPYFFAPDSLSLDGEMWGRLHTLKLNVSLANLAIGTHEMFPILEGCPNLRECMLDLGFLNRPILGRAPAQRILVLPHLKELHLIDARANNILGTILSQLSAPTLESFSLFNTPISHFRMDGETLTHVNEFLERSSCSLLKLLLVMCQSPDLKSNEFVQFLRGIHGTLQNLIMESRADEDTYFMNDDILRALTRWRQHLGENFTRFRLCSCVYWSGCL
ncbi:hypothetical protein K435DRAFT_962194 [Dendrothele bispora CBS 962.96]|uniref:Uncharacterized protein n=1 Tax=Dendrothele bispora (strain CBS 962.96) TaxID=1314807 RepID=A0A4S8MMS5_DENBC|nr:hypothetical protein K435DRAFT_962194 [Dendrothele bispora CBS 962.96]